MLLGSFSSAGMKRLTGCICSMVCVDKGTSTTVPTASPVIATIFIDAAPLRMAMVSCMAIHKSANAANVYRW